MNGIRCQKCGDTKSKESFSKNQLKKKEQARCLECTNETAPKKAPAEPFAGVKKFVDKINTEAPKKVHEIRKLGHQLKSEGKRVKKVTGDAFSFILKAACFFFFLLITIIGLFSFLLPEASMSVTRSVLDPLVDTDSILRMADNLFETDVDRPGQMAAKAGARAHFPIVMVI